MFSVYSGGAGVVCSLGRVGEQAADEYTIRVHSFFDPSAVEWHCKSCFKILLNLNLRRTRDS